MIRSPRIEVVGHGIAAATSALLASQRGYEVSFESASNPSERIVSVPRGTVDLVQDLTGLSIARTVPSRWITARRVAWESRKFTSIPLEALVFDADALARAMADRFVSQEAKPVVATESRAPTVWTVVAEGRTSGIARVTAGMRQAVGGWIPGLPGLDEATTLVACVPHAWIFATPHPVSGITLVAVHPATCNGTTPREILEDAVEFLWPGFGARLERHTGRSVLAAPSFAPDCASHGRIAAGEAAISFDPLRGDGVGNAVRGALLAQSVIAAIAGGTDERQCLAYYRSRLARAFAEHVQTCSAHYLRAWNAHVWCSEIALIAGGAAKTAAELTLGFRLEGRELVPA